jgi:hypothetical protein
MPLTVVRVKASRRECLLCYAGRRHPDPKSGAASLLESVNAGRARLYGDFRGPGRLTDRWKMLCSGFTKLCLLGLK